MGYKLGIPSACVLIVLQLFALNGAGLAQMKPAGTIACDDPAVDMTEAVPMIMEPEGASPPPPPSSPTASLLGCYMDSSQHALPQLLGYMTKEECIASAAAQGYQLVALQQSRECWSGSVTREEATRYGPSTACTSECVSSEGSAATASIGSCGGPWANSLYQVARATAGAADAAEAGVMGVAAAGGAAEKAGVGTMGAATAAGIADVTAGGSFDIGQLMQVINNKTSPQIEDKLIQSEMQARQNETIKEAIQEVGVSAVSNDSVGIASAASTSSDGSSDETLPPPSTDTFEVNMQYVCTADHGNGTKTIYVRPQVCFEGSSCYTGARRRRH